MENRQNASEGKKVDEIAQRKETTQRIDAKTLRKECLRIIPGKETRKIYRE